VSTIQEEDLRDPPIEHPKGYVEPQTWNKMLNDVYQKPWLKASQKEYDQIEQKGVWVWEHPPPNTPVMGTKWVYVRKTKVDGSLDKFKARICVQGFRSIPGVHHFETYAPTASAAAARMMFALACAKDLRVDQMDVSGAFLYATLDEDIYCHPPEGYEDPEGRVWKLKKSLYGLKQALREWIAKLTRVLETAGFVRSIVEPSLFKLRRGDRVLHLLVFVDDLLLATDDDDLMDYAKQTLTANFEMTDMGPALKYLGWHITRDKEKGEMWISLEQRINRSRSRIPTTGRNSYISTSTNRLAGVLPS